ncbi:MAG TPA: hypothetical protein VGZ47_10500 [Gemmataceae bacterium]|jgi:hypothetical protein|nr:hypothetical protein [Gemmataceae bacterium]
MEMPSERRERQIGRMKRFLLQRGHPHLLIAIFLAITGLSGFLASLGMHACGLNSMAARYPLAVGVAYLVFLMCLGLWLAAHRKSRGAPPATYHSPGMYYPYYYDPYPWYAFPRFGSGSQTSAASVGSSTSSSGKGANLDFGDGDGLVLVVVVLIIVAVLAALAASVYMIFMAPALLAEVLVDGVFLAGLARRLRAPNAPHWSIGAIRRTWAPVAIVAIVFFVLGLTLEYFVPGAHSMSEAIRLAR